jgi:hypothetical protein
MISNMKPFAIISIVIAFACVAVHAKDKAIQEFILDEQTVFAIQVSQDRVTTVSFPGPISAIDAAQVTTDPKKPAPFQIAHTKGSSFFSVRSLTKKAMTNVNIRWRNKTYVLELVDSDEPLLSVIFQCEPDKDIVPKPLAVTPERLLTLLDKAKSYPLLRAYHPEALVDVDYKNYGNEPRKIQANGYEIKIQEAFRFNPEDTLIFRLMLTNQTDKALCFAPSGFSLRVGERTYPQSISDASGFIPPKTEVPAYFAVTGTPNGGRNDISLKNDFYVILDAKAEEPKEDAK